jgi:hypothetical protein
LINPYTVRALRAKITANDHDQIKALDREFGKLKVDFDRAVNVATLTLAGKSGKYRSFWGTIYGADILS